jgi:hypothetical protein
MMHPPTVLTLKRIMNYQWFTVRADIHAIGLDTFSIAL